MSALEVWARSRLTPQQLHQADLYADQMKISYLDVVRRNAEVTRNAEAERKVDEFVRETTHGILGQPQGITREQLYAIRNNDEIPRQHRPLRSQANLDDWWRHNTKRLDPPGGVE